MAITVVVLQKTLLVLQYSQLLCSHYCGNTVKFVSNPQLLQLFWLYHYMSLFSASV